MQQWKRTIAAVFLAVVLALGVAIPVSQPACAAVSVDGWATQTSGTSATLYAVWGDSLSSVFASGEFGIILHYDGNSWTPMNTGIKNVFYGIWGSSSDDVFAVGQNGVVIHYDGSAWTQVYNNPGTHLYGVWGTSSSDVYVVGNGGTILHYDGSVWTTMPNSDNDHLMSVWGTASDDIFAAGNGGTILHYDGTSWTGMAAGNPPTYACIWGAASNDVFAVGNNGSIMHYDGICWTSMTSGVGNDLDAVWGTSGTDVFVAGASGRILHYDGESWEPMDSGISRNMWGIWGNDPLNVYAVGQGGAILHYKEPAPVVISVDPTYGNQGETISVTIDGGNFGTTTSVDFGADISVDNFTINNQTRITAIVTIEGDAISGPKDVTITNAYGTGTLYGGFSVPLATVTGVSPSSGNQGETIEVTISGTNMGAATGLSFGFGIAVDPPTMQTPTQITTQITIDADAVSGSRSVSVLTPGYTAVLTDAFTVNGPTVTAVDPAVADQGETLDVTITGTNLGNATDADFGDGITVNEVTVNSATVVTANITIDAAAVPGNRDVAVITTDGTAVLTSGFAVAIAPPMTTGVDPASGIQGETLDVTISGSFLSDLVDVSFSDGIAINYHSTDNATWIVVSITIDPAAALGARDIVVTTSNGVATLEDAFEVLAPEPTISGVSPLSGIQGETLDVTITGTDLNDPEAVSFGEGISVNYYSTDNATQMVVNITIDTAAATGARDITITTAGGTATSESGFAVGSAPPTITGASPASGMQGQTLDVTVSGTYLTDPSGVSFGDGITVNSYTTGDFSQTVVNITIDATATLGARDVTVTTAGGTASLEDAFTVVAAEPTITGVTPESGIQGQTLDVTITGTYLTNPSAVSFGDGITVNSYTTGDFSQTVVNITIDAMAALGARDITVTTAGGTASLESGFAVNAAAPTITGTSPATGIQGQTLDVTISGTYLTDPSVISFGDGIAVNGYTDEFSEIVVNITIDPMAALGARDITVTTSGGTATLEAAFAVGAAPPTITGISPATGIQGQTLDVTISGTYLTDPSVISFGDGIAVNGYTDEFGEIVVNITVDAMAALGATDVTVTTAGGTATYEDAFEIAAPEPTLTGVSPASGIQGQNLTVVITGTNLTYATGVDFGQGITVAEFNVDSATRLTASIVIGAAAAPGTRDISVVTLGGTATMSNSFTVAIPAPNVEAVSPGTGYQGQTLEIVISGTNFAGATVVHFGTGLTVDGFTVDSATQITVTLLIADDAPAGAEDVIVTTPGGTDTLEGCFVVAIPAPGVGGINVPSGRQGETLDVIITGTRLDGATSVSLGDGITVDGFTVDSATQITASITIDKDAEIGPRDVSVVTPGGDDSLPAVFDVEEAGNGCAWWMWLLVALAVLLIGLLFLGARRKKRTAEE